jgi:hypothetical protein
VLHWAIAANCLALAGRIEEALTLRASIHKALPSYRIDNLLAAFRLSPDPKPCSARAPGASGWADGRACGGAAADKHDARSERKTLRVTG